MKIYVNIGTSGRRSSHSAGGRMATTLVATKNKFIFFFSPFPPSWPFLTEGVLESKNLFCQSWWERPKPGGRHFWRERGAFQRLAFGQSTAGNDVVATIFIRLFSFLFFSRFFPPRCHFGAPWRPFWILQAVRRCRRWASAPFAARLVFW